jgi:hypothetical protein
VDKDSRTNRINGRNAILMIRRAVRYHEETRFSKKRKRDSVRPFTLAKLDFAAKEYGKMARIKKEEIPNHRVPGGP